MTFTEIALIYDVSLRRRWAPFARDTVARKRKGKKENERFDSSRGKLLMVLGQVCRVLRGVINKRDQGLRPRYSRNRPTYPREQWKCKSQLESESKITWNETMRE